MWPVLWRFVETILILYTIASYAFVIYSLWLANFEKAKEISAQGKILFSLFAPLVMIVALLTPLPKEEK